MAPVAPGWYPKPEVLPKDLGEEKMSSTEAGFHSDLRKVWKRPKQMWVKAIIGIAHYTMRWESTEINGNSTACYHLFHPPQDFAVIDKVLQYFYSRYFFHAIALMKC